MADAAILEVAKPEEDASLEVFDEVAEQAADKLGYTLLKEKRDKLADKNRLVRALLKLGIPVYDRESVERYKAATLREARRAKRQEWFKFWRWPAGTAAVFLPLAFTFHAAFHNEFVSAMILAIGLLALAFSLIAIKLARDEAGKIEWRKQFVSQHNTSEIPTFVLTRALTLRTGCPGVNFEIESILAEKIDPFLIAEAGGEHFYIAYWNEPGFRVGEKRT